MLLFIVALNPLFYPIDRCLKGIQINHRQRTTAVIAYADEVTILLTDPSDIAVADIGLFLGECSYVLEPQPEENPRAVKRWVYNTVRGLKQNTAE
jgi:hypothetical protein